MSKIIRALALTLALSVYASAGDGIIQGGTPAASPTPPPPPASATLDEPAVPPPAEGEEQDGLMAAVSQATLDILQSFLTLF
jgi:hypothetical protein